MTRKGHRRQKTERTVDGFDGGSVGYLIGDDPGHFMSAEADHGEDFHEDPICALAFGGGAAAFAGIRGGQSF